MADRLTLIKSVIAGALTHSFFFFFVYRWPSSIIKHLNSCIKNFLWSGSISNRKVVTVAWKVVCKKLADGRLGVRDLDIANKTFLKKASWYILVKDNWGANFLKNFFFGKQGLPRTYLNSYIWFALKKSYIDLEDEIRWLPWKNSTLNFWSPNWLGKPLMDSLDIPDVIRKKLPGSFFDYWKDGWAIPSEVVNRFPSLPRKIANCNPGPPDSDRLIWTLSTNREITSKDIFQNYMGIDNGKPWSRYFWKNFITPRHYILTWKVPHKRISTDNNLKKHGYYVCSRCSLYETEEETMDHIFVQCRFSKALWRFHSDYFKRCLSFLENFEVLFLKTMKEKFSLQIHSLRHAGIIFICWLI